jgi:hypothetical protein
MDFIVEESRYALAGLPAFIVGLNITVLFVGSEKPIASQRYNTVAILLPGGLPRNLRNKK